MTSDDTVADLLAKAGFTAAASAEETEGNDKAYFDSWGSPTFRGNKSVQQPDGSWAYWATMFDGDSANYASAQLTSKLQENGRYQYIYTSDATFAYDEEIPQLAIYTVNDPLAGAIKPDPKPEPEPDEPANDAIAVDSAAYNTLFGTIASSYAGTSEEWKALELAAAGRVSSVDVATLVANAKAANGSPETTNLQRFILALTAVGKTEEAAELVQTMATSDISTTYVNGQAFALLSYESGAYDAPANALETEAELVAKLLSAQQASGGWTWKGAAEGDDPDTTAMVITALASRVSDASVKAAVDKGLEALRAMQHEDGGFRASGDAADGPINVSSTSCVVVAPVRLGRGSGGIHGHRKRRDAVERAALAGHFRLVRIRLQRRCERPRHRAGVPGACCVPGPQEHRGGVQRLHAGEARPGCAARREAGRKRRQARRGSGGRQEGARQDRGRLCAVRGRHCRARARRARGGHRRHAAHARFR
ncbi:hypothetical protein HMPREF9458_02685 [Eggerthella lenta 1_1_60AFAA]|uniref:prenyltransferase/squalene oxidase repeat-containing protein n=1 Tax=Eggerthella lenta TaxID=84112 RepID=UPI00050FA362|nr:prenyltransferase/squalene oxidase repeat-containing protein [Eggerthella lenta]KGI71271.1 hypothetical protein HMPREF9458_02685 [Eggerthella lenta 1_1_60AFAA]